MVGVYGLFDSESGECLYVGQSSDIEYRVKRHMWRLKSHSHLDSFTSWFISVGSTLSRIEYRVLDECEDIDSIKNGLEIKRFQELNPKFYGKVPSIKESWEMSEETKRRIAKSVSEYWAGRDTISKGSIVHCGFCGEEFTSYRNHSRFCSSRCAQIARSSEIDIDLARSMYYAGSTLRDISDVVGVSHVTVRKYLLESGVTLRSPGERG